MINRVLVPLLLIPRPLQHCIYLDLNCKHDLTLICLVPPNGGTRDFVHDNFFLLFCSSPRYREISAGVSLLLSDSIKGVLWPSPIVFFISGAQQTACRVEPIWGGDKWWQWTAASGDVQLGLAVTDSRLHILRGIGSLITHNRNYRRTRQTHKGLKRDEHRPSLPSPPLSPQHLQPP